MHFYKTVILKNAYLILLLSAWGLSGYAQITTTRINNTATPPPAPKLHYDSTRNFLGSNVALYAGQDLYLSGKPVSERRYGYTGLVLDYKNENIIDKSNIYKCNSLFNSTYDDVAGKYFKVLDVVKHSKFQQDPSHYGSKYFLKLQEKETNDIIYSFYDTVPDFTFDFVVVGFFEKQKKLLYGKEYIFSDIFLSAYKDINTATKIAIKTGQKWKCVDFTIEESTFQPAAIFQNESGEKIAVKHEELISEYNQH